MRDAPLPFTLRQLQYVQAVAELRNFHRAAERCRVAQPSLSSQIAALEGALGVRLFERDRRGVVLTSAGQAFVARAARILMESEDLVREAARFLDPLGGTLRLGVIPTVGPYVLSRLAPLLREAFPSLMVLWTEERTALLVAALQEGRLDGAILALEADLEDLEWALLARDPFHLALPLGHPLARSRGPIALEALEGERILLLDDGHCLRQQALDACKGARVEEMGYRATSLPTLVQMVASGAGITLLPALALAMEASHAPIRTRPFRSPAPCRTLVLAWRRGSHAGTSLRALGEALRGGMG
jgi:LysR family hydrogen peroxide-inducible transcriptional activator